MGSELERKKCNAIFILEHPVGLCRTLVDDGRGLVSNWIGSGSLDDDGLRKGWPQTEARNAQDTSQQDSCGHKCIVHSVPPTQDNPKPFLDLVPATAHVHVKYLHPTLNTVLYGRIFFYSFAFHIFSCRSIEYI
jgi:hypothetical protein